MRTEAFTDRGLLSPVSVGVDAAVSDTAVLEALIGAEVALLRAFDEIGLVSFRAEDLDALRATDIDADALAADAVASGNPVVPLVTQMREAAPASIRPWLHRGATSQDILDTALMIVSKAAALDLLGFLDRAAHALSSFGDGHRDTVAAGRTLTQHAVPTTVGLRAANWRRGIERARTALVRTIDQLPAQLGGAAGTMAALVEHVHHADPGADADAAVARVREAYAAAVGLRHGPTPWHTQRWPVTELADALTQAIDSLGKLATDVATLSRTEIGELSELQGGGSSTMPQKRNPARSVLIRSAVIRAPQLNATLHLASALAADERPDGAWHAEWPTLRELLRLALGCAAHAADLAEGLQVNSGAVAENLALTRGLIVAERLSIVLGQDRAADIVTLVAGGADIRELVDPGLLDPADYLGLADAFTKEDTQR